uniref:Transmembrane protein 254 n=1 Tax=Oryzias sinensis TaxID=183150 RepID=A0A8C7WTM9_9TELE
MQIAAFPAWIYVHHTRLMLLARVSLSWLIPATFFHKKKDAECLCSCLRWWAAFAIHVFEAIVSLRVCSNKGISNSGVRCLWFVQTFLFGFASLGLLLKYNPQRPKQR